jgi:hypothetical protein
MFAVAGGAVAGRGQPEAPATRFLWYQPQNVGGKWDRSRTGFGATQPEGLASMAPGIFHNDGKFKTFTP